MRDTVGTLVKITGKVITRWIENAVIKTRNWHIKNTFDIKLHWKKEKDRISKKYHMSTRFLQLQKNYPSKGDQNFIDF